MLMKIAHHNDGKEKSQSHDCYLFNDGDYFDFDIMNIHGYGETIEEAVENLKQELWDRYLYYMSALKVLLYESDVLDNNIVEGDCLGRKIK